MADLRFLLWWVFVIFTIICLIFCIEATIRYRYKRGIDKEDEFAQRYKYFGQPIYDHYQKIQGYELLLREFDSVQKQWRLPRNVNNFPLSKMVLTIRQIDPQIINSIKILALNMTVSQITDFRASYFFQWVLGLINNRQLSIEIDARDIQQASFIQRRKLHRLLRKLDHPHIKITIENVDSTKRTFLLLKNLLPYTDYVKFNIRSFNKSPEQWIDITLAQWQQYLKKHQVTPVVGKVERDEQDALVNQLDINLRQGYVYGMPDEF
ncbi:EAL domain-containing protein [Limosilactobacillus sp. STM2_1]|uniref:EAL domain-containing protein n=1 Tax=Limosilactobacillus rudii TaxID=2759755 RepID=A0A7W3YNR4_9LACO|nr:EAL domain-containing protein [Limosilactobacillus rudii]MBB1079516.1 EAL domain-containing protein [Limosilactobacillus rudii]MBB1097562.1 EAL domain-containing protein [Limosilactobacillus rudii]MCD7134671.1 EAL domain-containing protein [Limosilactobacillus rudii]